VCLPRGKAPLRRRIVVALERAESNPWRNRYEPDPGRRADRRIGVHELVVHAFATRPTVSELYAYDIGASPDKLWIQRPANAGTLITPVSTGLDLGSNFGFDIAGAANVGWLAGTPQGRYASRLYRLDVNTGRMKSLGRIDDGPHTITGLAAVQDQ
jgi:hypothetical protein